MCGARLGPTERFVLGRGRRANNAELLLTYGSLSLPFPLSPQTRAEVRRVFLSYLRLLVNSKDDLALAHVLDVPGRALGRAAFTDLKHAARRANTSLFLVRTAAVGTA